MLCEQARIMSDITKILLKNCSPYISRMIYDIQNRELNIECVNNPEEMKPVTNISCTGITKYHEESNENNPDDDLIDSIIGINWLSSLKLCIHTEKKEIIVELEHEPESISIA
jgi:hypothetical protein